MPAVAGEAEAAVDEAGAVFPVAGGAAFPVEADSPGRGRPVEGAFRREEASPR